MRKAMVGSLVAVTMVVAALMILGPTIGAQVRGGQVGPGTDRLLLQGPDSEIGVSVRELRAEEISGATLEQPGGVFVQDVREGAPAARARFRSGDIITSFDGERVRGVRHLSRLVLETPPGRTVSSIIIRGTERQTLQVTPDATRRLGTRVPDIGRGMRAIPRDFNFDFDFPERASRARLGVSLTALSDQLASYFGVKDGALVSAVEAYSPAAQAGVRAGDVITAIDGRMVRTPRDVTAGIRESAPGSAVEIRIVRDRKEMTVKPTVPDRRPGTRDRIPV